MDVQPFVDSLLQELLTAAQAGGDDARLLAERLTAPLASTARLTLLGALSAATDEITRDLAPGSVEVRLRGLDPSFVVTPPPQELAPPDITATPEAVEEGPAARINFRPPEALKTRIDDAAAREGLSVNAWLVRVVSSVLAADRPTRPESPSEGGASGDRHHVGWVR